MAALVIALPLLGIWVADYPLDRYLEFPPLTRYVEHAEFSWAVFGALAIGILAVGLPLLLRVLVSKPTHIPSREQTRHEFPWWGWLGLALTLVSWFLAWTRFECVEPFQKFTFTPIWLGYILVVNGLSFKLSGHSMLSDKPFRLLLLFLASAVFWWYFEYLNRFVQNWHYKGVGDLSRGQYFLFATLPFSTVMPAVLGTYDLLNQFPRLRSGVDNFIPINPARPRMIAWIALSASCASLALIGIYPSYLFPLLWLSPLFIICSLQAIRGGETIFSPIVKGDWQRIFLLALAALVCGFFWEMWNFHSLAKWQYSVPFVERFRIFEMPILGYAGYLPFGLECGVIADWIIRRQR